MGYVGNERSRAATRRGRIWWGIPTAVAGALWMTFTQLGFRWDSLLSVEFAVWLPS